MKPVTNNLTDIFNADVRYVVPLYQRPYVWNQDQHWEPLWEDLLVLLEHYMTAEGEPVRHFLGAIVLDQEDHVPGEATRRLVIDGQQRLTTLQLLLVAAARNAEKDGAERQSRLLTKLIHNDPDLAAGDDRFKVWPTNANQAAFRAVMQPNGSAAKDDPQNTIQEAYQYFVGAIGDWVHFEEPSADEIALRHEALRVTLSDLLQIVSINLEPGDNAQVIFETLNARGTPLLAMDLVKNALFYRAHREKADVDKLNAEVWEPELGLDYWRKEVRQGRLTRPRAELFLMHWLAMKLGRIVPATELFSQFRTHVLDSPAKTQMDTLIRELCADAKVLRGFDSQAPGTPEERFFRHLAVLDTTTVLPVALLLYRSPEITQERRHRGLLALESWLVRRMLCGMTAARYNRLVSDLIKLVKADLALADDVIVEFLRSSDAHSAVWPQDDKVTAALSGRGVYGWIAQRRVVMVLAAVELELRRSNKVEDIYSLPTNLTLEHVMPQKWIDHWELPEGALAEDRDVRLDRLGNLTLTSGPLNSSLSNSAWATKRPALAKHSLLALNQQITAHDVWDEETIDTRGRDLANAVCTIWPGPQDPMWPSEAPAQAADVHLSDGSRFGVVLSDTSPGTSMPAVEAPQIETPPEAPPTGASKSETTDGGLPTDPADRADLARRIVERRDDQREQWGPIMESLGIAGGAARKLYNEGRAVRGLAPVRQETKSHAEAEASDEPHA